MSKDELKDRISMALKDPVLQQGFEVICKENAALKEQCKSYEEIIDNGSATLMKEKLKNYKQLTKAKEIIRNCLRLWNGVMTEGTVKALISEAEQFLREEEE